jgi:hypothetical protein
MTIEEKQIKFCVRDSEIIRARNLLKIISKEDKSQYHRYVEQTGF